MSSPDAFLKVRDTRIDGKTDPLYPPAPGDRTCNPFTEASFIFLPEASCSKSRQSGQWWLFSRSIPGLQRPRPDVPA